MAPTSAAATVRFLRRRVLFPLRFTPRSTYPPYLLQSCVPFTHDHANARVSQRCTSTQTQPVLDVPSSLRTIPAHTTSTVVPDATVGGGPFFTDLGKRHGLHPVLLDVVVRLLGMTYMTPVQALTLPTLLPPHRHDCVAQAKTGTGKTIAFLLPGLDTLLKKRPSTLGSPSLLILCPTRELAMQIHKEAERLLQQFRTYSVCLCVGGKGAQNDTFFRQRFNCDVLVATPGQLQRHLLSGDEVRKKFANLDTLVLDEADRLLDMGFLPQLKTIFENLPSREQSGRQTMLFSATIPSHVDRVSGIAFSSGYKHISTIPKGELTTHQHVPQHLIKVPTFADLASVALAAIDSEADRAGRSTFKAIVFAPTAGLADYYGTIFNESNTTPQVIILHSRQSQSKRTKNTDAFREAESGILVATDVVARGMDLPGVKTVFQVGSPRDEESYIHRLGRTARAGADGRGLLIVTEAEWLFLERILKKISLGSQDPDFRYKDSVTSLSGRLDEELQGKIFQSWLGFYKDLRKPMKWNDDEFVAQANAFGRDGLGSPIPIGIRGTVIRKMGLKHVKGLKIVR